MREHRWPFAILVVAALAMLGAGMGFATQTNPDTPKTVKCCCGDNCRCGDSCTCNAACATACGDNKACSCAAPATAENDACVCAPCTCGVCRCS